MNQFQKEGQMLEEIVFTVMTLRDGRKYERDYRTRKPNYQIDIVEYSTDIVLLRKVWPFSWLYRKPVRYIEVKKTQTSVQQKEVADIFMKAVSLNIAPKDFIVVTNNYFVENIYHFLKQMKKKSRDNGLKLIDGKTFTRMIKGSKMFSAVPRKEKTALKKKGAFEFEDMTYCYDQYIARYGALI